MAIKFRKLIMLSILFPLGLGTGLGSGEVSALSMPTKEEVSYATSDDLNDHDTNHSSDFNWIALSTLDDSSGITITGGASSSDMSYYYLDENIVLTRTLTIRNYVTLCLNGKYLDGNNNGSVISVSSNAYFNLCDCSGDDTGIITNGSSNSSGGGVYVNERATFNMYGGTIFNNKANYFGGGVYVHFYYSTFNMYGGIISNNEAAVDGGGGVTVYYGNLNMYGGTISNNESDEGGGVFVYATTFNMYDGAIFSNTASSYGGGIAIFSSEFNMYDGTLSGNTASEGSGVEYGESSTINMYGGYFDNDTYRKSGTLSIKGGYFGLDAYNDLGTTYLDGDCEFIDISTLGADLDNNYRDGYPYAVYAKSITDFSVENVIGPTYGTEYTPSINTDATLYTSVAYTYKGADDNEISGLPTDAGEHTAIAHFLYTTTEGNITTNSYGTTEFSVTISKGQAVISADATQTKTYDGTTPSVDYEVTVGDLEITDDATVTENWYDEDGEPISSAPTEVGTYKVTLTVTDTTNYDGTSIDVTYTITENISNTSTDVEDNPTGLPTWAIIVIVIGSVLVVGAIAFLVYFLFFRKRSKKKIVK